MEFSIVAMPLISLIWIAAIAYVGVFWLEADGSKKFLLPEMGSFEPLAIAELRGGVAAVIQTTVFTLLQRGMIEIRRDEASDFVLTIASTGQQCLNPIEEAIYSAVAVKDIYPDDLKAILARNGILESHLIGIRAKLREAHLLRDESSANNAKTKRNIATFVIWVVPFCLPVLPVHLGNQWLSETTRTIIDSIGLGIALILAPVLLIIQFWLIPKMFKLVAGPVTILGKRYLEALEKRHTRIMDDFPFGLISPEESIVGVAVFGQKLLLSHYLYKSIGNAFPDALYWWDDKDTIHTTNDGLEFRITRKYRKKVDIVVDSTTISVSGMFGHNSLAIRELRSIDVEDSNDFANEQVHWVKAELSGGKTVTLAEVNSPEEARLIKRKLEEYLRW